ncbi:Kae1-associated serine/threonine protein kinase [Candidatus Woesearchaeota archaeon]|nr:Kae1-associated serine/threonine protein kinase [Candidatus Woesearchaeota archaeon]
MELIAQGAEAKIWKEDSKIVKERIKKNYRIRQIDSTLRKTRTKLESSLLARCQRHQIKVPRVLKEDQKTMRLEIEFIDGQKVRDYVDEHEADLKELKSVFKIIGKIIAKLHSIDVVHGDLTTSNMIKKGDDIYLIDFGLGNFTSKDEDKAVDIHLFKECIVSKHHKHWKELWDTFVAGYTNKDTKKILKRLEVVEKRGRYKH